MWLYQRRFTGLWKWFWFDPLEGVCTTKLRPSALSHFAFRLLNKISNWDLIILRNHIFLYFICKNTTSHLIKKDLLFPSIWLQFFIRKCVGGDNFILKYISLLLIYSTKYSHMCVILWNGKKGLFEGWNM